MHNIDRGFLVEHQLRSATEDDLQKAVSDACDFIIRLKNPGLISSFPTIRINAGIDLNYWSIF
ncbi:hypothetical protein DEA98_29195 (plasmid) [Brucella pseudogrignonensis]|nr:hypothetical protein [Brucella pseudogrignonensis]